MLQDSATQRLGAAGSPNQSQGLYFLAYHSFALEAFSGAPDLSRRLPARASLLQAVTTLQRWGTCDC
jgi:hypothetical protein